MGRRLPPLNSLRAFEAGARHLSFTLAAEELNVTQAAISHQVRGLEDTLQVKLFERRTRQLELTAAGRRLLPPVSEAFDRIAAAIADIEPDNPDLPLTVTVTPHFGARWLAWRLSRFWQAHPEIDLRLHHSTRVMDLSRGEVDMGIRFGRGVWPGVVAEKLVSVELIPVCSPALLKGPHPLREPSDLKHHVLLHEEDFEEWVQWLILAGAEGVNGRSGRVIGDPVIAVQLAVAGEGVALTNRSLSAGDLAEGRLVAPFEQQLNLEFGYYLVYRAQALERPRVRAFRDFLLAEAREGT
jgi:LysR family glycine cleavage system transcriptional activator